MFWKKEQASSPAESTPPPAVAPQEENMQVLEMMYQMEAFSDMFSRMARVCFDKCVTKFKDGDLSVAEMSCNDRCVVKYLESHTLVGLKLREQSEQMMPPQ